MEMNAKQAREFYLEYLNTIYVERKVDELHRFFAQDVKAHPTPPGTPPGLPGVKALIHGWVDAFGDIGMKLDGFVYENGIMATRILMSGTQIGPFMGIPSSGKRFEMIDQPHYQLRNGKVVEIWDCPDMFTMLQQIGAISLPGKAA